MMELPAAQGKNQLSDNKALAALAAGTLLVVVSLLVVM
jgi:hypothetical protein